jgi:predicted 3-demethylubiquinone-9 3-methyltransferase (glyoxalase superfamily)
MMATSSQIKPFLWFASEAEEAANHYMAAFKDSKIISTMRNGPNGPGPEGSVLVIEFSLNGQHFCGLNGGPMFTPNESVSFAITAEDQAEVDFLWEHLGKGGVYSQCGWLKDKWGFSWQIVPRRFFELTSTGDGALTGRVMAAMMQMQKFDVAKLEAAAKG